MRSEVDPQVWEENKGAFMEPPTELDRRTKDQFLPELLSLMPLCNTLQHNHHQDGTTEHIQSLCPVRRHVPDSEGDAVLAGRLFRLTT